MTILCKFLSRQWHANETIALLFPFRSCATILHRRNHQSDKGVVQQTPRWGFSMSLPPIFLCSRLSVPRLSFDHGVTSDHIISGRRTGNWPPPPCWFLLGARSRKTRPADISLHTTGYDSCIVIINHWVFFLVFFILLHRSIQTV